MPIKSSNAFAQVISKVSDGGTTAIASDAATPSFNRLVLRGLDGASHIAATPFTMLVGTGTTSNPPNVPTADAGVTASFSGAVPQGGEVVYEFAEVKTWWRIKVLSAGAITIIVETSMS